MVGMAALILGTMVVLLLLGFPMKVPLTTATLAVLLVYFPDDVTPAIIIQQWIGGITPAALIAVPMFVLAADIMTRGQTSDRLLDIVSSFVGHMRGGLPITTAVSCTLFGAMSGSTQATVVAIGGPLRPRLLKAGYSDSFSTALIINASDIALLIPPSIGMIVYGVVSGTSIGELFIAGVGPGLLILLAFSGYCYIASLRLNIARQARSTWTERRTAFSRAVLPLGFPAIIMGGIYSGVFSPTESAAVCVAYAMFLEIVVYRDMSWQDLHKAALSTGMITAVVFVLVGARIRILLGDFIRKDSPVLTERNARPYRTVRLLDDHDVDLRGLFCWLHVRRSNCCDSDSDSDLSPDRGGWRHRSGSGWNCRHATSCHRIGNATFWLRHLHCDRDLSPSVSRSRSGHTAIHRDPADRRGCPDRLPTLDTLSPRSGISSIEA